MSSITPFTALEWWTTASQHVTGARTLCKMIWEMLDIFSPPPTALLFKTRKLPKTGSICINLQSWRSILWVFYLPRVIAAVWEVHLGQIPVLDIRGGNVDRNVCKMLCFRQYCKWINLFTLENGRSAFGKWENKYWVKQVDLLTDVFDAGHVAPEASIGWSTEL